ncbi:FxSxx-COOH system tetratricopeptide repeat protein [Promicromonospora sukumoe]|uniref:FxSxx-COOH system tetratricopeptide repeat protein n=1 Tax=Promicromonospora sukumoe TaxID=88382 RepID=UPI0018DB5C6C|nr:FxSxx-COOH system tetratricopeptide repeat protein [Promicromonospora sukumoe]
MVVDPKSLAVGVAQVALRGIGQADVADMLGDLAGVARRTPETVAYERFLRDVETKIAALRRGAVTSHPAESAEIDAVLEQVRTRFEALLTGTDSAVATAHLEPDRFRALVREAAAAERDRFGGVGPQVYEDALAHVTEAFIAFAPNLPQFATVMLTVIANGVAGVRGGVGRLEANDARMEGKLDSVLSGLRQAPARTGPVRTGTLPGRAPEFVDTGILDRLTEQVARGGQATLVSLTGLRGVGKTQVAAEFARRCVSDGWPVIAWVNAESRESLATDLTVLANEVVGVRDGETTETLLGRWRAAWNSEPDPRRLLVLDNLTDADHVRGLLPDAGAATVIVTTSDASAVISRDVLDVASWTPEQAVSYLLAWTGLDDPDGALRVAEEVGFLPLALAQASWVMGQRRRRKPDYGFAEYVGELDEVGLDRVLTAERGGEYPLKTAQAIELSVEATLEACDDENAPGAAVLGVLAHLDPAGVPVAWLDVLDEAAGGLDVVLDAMEASALVTPSQDGTSIVMHRLVGRLLRDRPGTEWDDAGGHVADVLESVEPDAAGEFWDQRQSALLLSNHANAVLAYAGSDEVAERLIGIAILCGYHLNTLHLLQPAIALLERLVVTAESSLGPDHLNTLTARDNLAGAYESAGDLGRAVPMYEQNLADTERVLGPDHPDTLTSRNNLAYAYQAVGDLRQAVPLFERTLDDRERALGPDDPGTLMSRNNLAHVYLTLGDHDRAVPLYERTLAAREQVLGPDDPDTLASRNNLAYAYDTAGDLARAVPLYERTLADRERVLGPDHPDTLMSRNNLAGAYDSAGDLAQAVPLYEQTLVDGERVLGPDHPSTLISRNNLAGAYVSSGDLGRGVPLYEQNLADRERVLGADHPDTLMSVGNLAHAYEAAGKLDLAIPLYEQALADRERVLGADHPNTLVSRDHLALALTEADQHERAVELVTANAGLTAGRFGPSDARTLDGLDTLGYVQGLAGEPETAEETWRGAHATAVECLGDDHAVTRLLAGRLGLE